MSYHRSIDGDNDFSRFFSLHFFSFFQSFNPVSVCVLLYGIILIQILIRFVKNIITACTRLHDSDPSHTLPRSVTLLPRAWSLRSLVFVFLEVRNHPPPPPPLWKTCLRHCVCVPIPSFAFFLLHISFYPSFILLSLLFQAY